MDPQAMEWLHLIVRWAHVIVAIAWIGHAFLFNELEDALVPPEDPDDPKVGELWMVHGGGFFQLVKTTVFPKKLRGTLHWFKWEAFFTWLSGFFLLSLVYYHGGGLYLLDSSVSDISYLQGVLIGVGSMVLGWAVYDGLCRTPLLQHGAAFAVVGIGLFAGLAYGLCSLLSARAAYIHVGAVIGTMMVGNVWMVIIPSMRRMLKGVEPGDKLDAALGKRAKLRSRHNNYLVYPLIFIMISNHFTFAYGHRHAWLVLTGIIALGAGIKHVMNVKGRAVGLWLALATALLGMGLIQVTSARDDDDDDDDDVAWVEPAGNTANRGNIAPAGNTAPAANTGNQGPVVVPGNTGNTAHTGHTPPDSVEVGDPPPAETGEVVVPLAPGELGGTVTLDGAVPARQELVMSGGCEHGHGDEEVYDTDVLVRDDGRIKNVLVWVKKGMEDWEGEVPRETAVLDQKGCLYTPRVVAIQAGQRVEFLNSDNFLHNVRIDAEHNRSINDPLASFGTSFRKRFKEAEMMLEVKCSVHPWMRAWLAVVPHPYFAVTGDDGRFVIPDLPPGTYTIEAWHEVFGTVEREITVEEGQSLPLDLVFTR